MHWYYVMNDQAVGPVTMEDLQSLLRTGVIENQTLVWKDGMGEWQALELFLPPPPIQQQVEVEQPKSSLTARTGPLTYNAGQKEPEEEVNLRPKNYSSTFGSLPQSQSPFAHGAITAPLSRSDTFSAANAPAYLTGAGGHRPEPEAVPQTPITKPEPEPEAEFEGFAPAATQPMAYKPVSAPQTSTFTPASTQPVAYKKTVQPAASPTASPWANPPPPAPESGLASLPHICEECRSSHLEEDMLRYGEYWICAACKPRFVVKLQEGSFRKGRLNYAAVISRFGSSTLDGLLVGCINVPVAILAQIGDTGRTLAHSHEIVFPIFYTLAQLFSLMSQLFYYFIFIWLMGGTPGQAYYGTRIVQPDGSPVTMWQAAGWSFCIIPMACMLNIPVLMAIWDPEKRTMQDFICNTRFIYKRS